jgi:hypothetical protein
MDRVRELLKAAAAVHAENPVRQSVQSRGSRNDGAKVVHAVLVNMAIHGAANT